MSLIRNGYVVSTRRGFLGGLFSALLALALFDTGAAIAQEVKQIKLTEKRQGKHRAGAKVLRPARAVRAGTRFEAATCGLENSNRNLTGLGLGFAATVPLLALDSWRYAGL